MDEDGAAGLGDQRGAHGAVIERAREQDCDHAVGRSGGGAAEQDIDGWADPVYPRFVTEFSDAVRDAQMNSGWGDEHRPGREGLSVAGVLGGKRAGTGQQRREVAGGVLTGVDGHQDAGRQVGGQSCHQSQQRLMAAGRPADDHQCAASPLPARLAWLTHWRRGSRSTRSCRQRSGRRGRGFHVPGQASSRVAVPSDGVSSVVPASSSIWAARRW